MNYFFAGIIIIFIALLLEKAFHMDMDVTGVTLALKQDIKKFVDAVKKPNVTRYSIQDTKFWNDVTSIIKRYADRNFDIKMKPLFEKNVPTIVFRFVQDHVLNEAELATLSGLVHKKFNEYIENEGLQWDSFTEYSVAVDYTYIYFHYAELECDKEPFDNLKKFRIRQRNNASGEMLCDEHLEEELKNVN